MSRFTAIKATDIASKGYPSCFVGLGKANNYSEPRFIDWMKQANLRRGTNFDYYEIFHPDLLGANGLPSALAEGDTSYRVMLREDWSDTSQEANIAIRIFHSGCTLGGWVNISVTDDSVPGQTDVILNNLGGHPHASFLVTPTDIANHSVNAVELEFLSNWQAGEIFRPTWTPLVSQFAGVRFMDWVETNSTAVTAFSQIKTKDQYIWSGVKNNSTSQITAGVPIEVCCDLCRELNVIGWFCVPHTLSDADVQLWAEELVAHYPAELPIVKVEYSNEVWNDMFGQSNWAGAQALALWGSDDATTRPSFYGMRSTQVMQIVRSVFEAAGRGDQLRCVLGVQTTNATRSLAALDAPTWQQNDPENYVAPSSVHDSVGVTGYFGWGDYVYQDNGQAIIDDLNANGVTSAAAMLNGFIGDDLDDFQARITMQMDFARQRGMRLDQYEGQQHADTGTSKFSGNNSAFYNSTIMTSGVGTDFIVGEDVLVNNTHMMRVISTASDYIVVGGAPSIKVGETVVGQTSGASQTVALWKDQVFAEGVEELLKVALWSQDQADLQDAARDIWKGVGGDWINHFVDIAPFSDAGNWGTKRSWDHVSLPWGALEDWNAANPRWFFN